MGDRVPSSSVLCRVGLHDWQAVPPDPAKAGAFRNTQYAVEVECSRCGRRKVLPLSTGHDQGGGGR